MAHQSFESISKFDTETLRLLLKNGDALERIWAAWALGLRHGTASKPELLAALHESPTPGTRRHLIVTLAGLGETEILLTMSNHDPDEYVRVTACQYLIRTIASRDKPTQNALIHRMLHDKSALIRGTVFDEGLKGVPPLLRADIEALCQDVDNELRQKATGVIAQLDYGNLLSEAGLEIGVKVFETAVRLAVDDKGLNFAYSVYEKLRGLSKDYRDSHMALRAAWANQHRRVNKSSLSWQERSRLLAKQMSLLPNEQAVDFIAELAIGWAIQRSDGDLALYQLGRSIYYEFYQ